MDRLRDWHQLYQDYQAHRVIIEGEHQEMHSKCYSFSVSSVPQVFTQQKMQLLMVYQRGMVKTPLSNLAEVLPQETLMVSTRLKAQSLVLLLRIMDERAEEEVVVECRPNAPRGYKASVRTYLLQGELDQNLVDSRGAQLQFSWNETQSIQGVTLEPETLYSPLDLDAIS